MNIFVGNLDYQTTESQLKDLFAEFGEVKSVNIVTDTYTKRSRGFAFVEMREKADGEKAIRKLDKSSLNQKSLVVNEARARNRSY